ncbi:glucose dehydrogenase [Methylovirgula ligni]|uniref:Glucose/arabinose dehydrogenase n=1 Tax=Methylovirgula ligni TaxID=569860 RepID=A0A3D9Z5Y5_9HYPH|nr:glucose dehydrogenase [Methylovirgula ligni]REF89660.1 glucose/arabinose dehydrogenase [Methylovirgula ligni]
MLKRALLQRALAITALMLGGCCGIGMSASAASAACRGDNGGLRLSPGWCATIFADKLGHARHMVVAPNGVLYVNTWSGVYYDNDRPPPGGFLIALKDSKGTGHADIIKRFGDDVAHGSAGGTGIGYYNGAIYAEENDKIVRFALPKTALVPESPYQVVLSGMPITGDHPMHPFIIDAQGNIFIDSGSPTNSCQAQNRMLESPGLTPCKELETRAGVWRYGADKLGQTFSPAGRYATGIRNGEGFGFDATGRLFVTQHGRDQLWQNWPKLYTPKASSELPAEALLELTKGADFGWPECYFDGYQKKLVLAPEYGGDGGRTRGVCAGKRVPVAVFPAHWAPNDLLIDNFPRLPAAYRGGAFLAFHGSWNRAPLPQGGYNVVFQPLKDGKAAGNFIVFANGFAGRYLEPGRAAYRPTGLAGAPDGAIFVSDDVHGRIWRLTYHGARSAPVAPTPGTPSSISAADNPPPPEGIHPDAGRSDAIDLPLAPGVTRDQLALGDRIFHGAAENGTCGGCHGSDAKGTPEGPNLTGTKIWSDGSLAGLEKTITEGVPKPRNYPGAMPAKGGASLTDADVTAVAAYVWALGHHTK